ncbi:MAG: hypothetical protein K8E66_06710, partial [Phycisphaerales bacterium]|nr:hypothetical protein [Phycisphaerales bacterium]
VDPAVARNGEGEAEIQKQTLELARNLLTFGEHRHAGATGRQPDPRVEKAADDLVDAFTGVGGQNFRQTALGLVSLNGLLTDAPYGFADDEFIAR